MMHGKQYLKKFPQKQGKESANYTLMNRGAYVITPNIRQEFFLAVKNALKSTGGRLALVEQAPKESACPLYFDIDAMPPETDLETLWTQKLSPIVQNHIVLSPDSIVVLLQALNHPDKLHIVLPYDTTSNPGRMQTRSR